MVSEIIHSVSNIVFQSFREDVTKKEVGMYSERHVLQGLGRRLQGAEFRVAAR